MVASDEGVAVASVEDRVLVGEHASLNLLQKVANDLAATAGQLEVQNGNWGLDEPARADLDPAWLAQSRHVLA